MGGIFVHEQVKALRDRGLDVAVLSGDPYWILSRNPRRIWWALRAWRNEPMRWNMLDGVPVMHFPYCVGSLFRNFIHGLTYHQGAARVIDQVRVQHPFDVIHAHTSFLDGNAAVKLGRRFGCPVVVTEHMGPFSVLTRNAAFRHMTRNAVRCADRVLAVSSALRRDMIAELGSDAERVEVLGNGFDPAVHQPSLLPAPSSGGPRMLWVGLVAPVKGVDRLIDATAAALKDVPALHLTLMGGGEGLEALRARADSLGMGQRLHVMPGGSRAEVAAAMRAHDFVVVSSHKETFSLVALEALANGRPVLTTACGGPEDFVTSGENGLVVANSTEGLTRGIVEMAELHQGLDIGTAAEDLRRERSWSAVAGRLEAVYSDLVSAGNASPAPAAAREPARRILMITTDHLMIDRRILQEAASLRDAGHTVEILAGFECRKPESYIWDGISISRFTYDWNDTRAQKLLRYVRFRSNRLWPHLWRATRKAVAVGTGINSFEHFVLRQVMQREFDVLHVHDFPLLNVGVEVKRRRGCALVYDAHELYHGQASLPLKVQRRYRRAEKRLIHKADAAITVNPYLAGIMARDYGCPAPHVLLNAAPRQAAGGADTVDLRAKLGLAPGARIVLYQGWMSPERGIDALVRAAPHMPGNVHLVLVGYGDTEAQLKAISREQGTDDGRVIFMGRMEPAELAAITPQADLGVIPYRPVDLNHLYCSPNKLFEFAVSGVPFIANDLPFLRDIAQAYGYGVLADLGDPAAFAAAITAVVADPQRLAALKAAAREAGTRLNWEVEEKKLLDIYASLPHGAGAQADAGPAQAQALAAGSA